MFHQRGITHNTMARMHLMDQREGVEHITSHNTGTPNPPYTQSNPTNLVIPLMQEEGTTAGPHDFGKWPPPTLMYTGIQEHMVDKTHKLGPPCGGMSLILKRGHPKSGHHFSTHPPRPPFGCICVTYMAPALGNLSLKSNLNLVGRSNTIVDSRGFAPVPRVHHGHISMPVCVPLILFPSSS